MIGTTRGACYLLENLPVTKLFFGFRTNPSCEGTLHLDNRLRLVRREGVFQGTVRPDR